MIARIPVISVEDLSLWRSPTVGGLRTAPEFRNGKSLSRTRCGLPFPQAGPHAFLHFDRDAINKLRARYGESYIFHIDAALGRHTISVLEACLQVGVRNGDLTAREMIDLYPVTDLSAPVVDALGLAIFGSTPKQKSAEDDFLAKARAVKAAILVAAADGSVIRCDPRDGSATFDARLAALVSFLLIGLDEI